MDLELSRTGSRAILVTALFALSTLPALGLGAAPSHASSGGTTHPAKLQVLRAGVSEGRLDVLADITKRADGDRVRVSFVANGKRSGFTAPVEDGRIRFKRTLPSSQRHMSTGIMEMSYEGNDRVRPTEVRLRAANGKAGLRRDLLSLDNGLITARGSLAPRIHGVVRLILSYERTDGSVGEWQGRASISDGGNWRLQENLPADAQGGGYLSIQFTGYSPRRVRGEQIAKELLDGQAFGLGEATSQEPAPAATAPAPAAAAPTPAVDSPAPSSDVPVPAVPVPLNTTLLSEPFDGPDRVFVSASAFWDSSDLGVSENPNWFAEGGTMNSRSNEGHVATDGLFRMWTRRTDLAFTKTEMDIRFNGWTSGTAGWHGINLWLNRKLRANSDGSRIDDGPQQEGYVVDFLNRDGKLYLMKKVGATYHTLDQRSWAPTPGKSYRWGGQVIDNGNGTSTIQVIVDGQVIQQVTDDGSIGGPRLLGGRTGLRADYANFTVDNITITR